ncbi:GPI ethanolamine phosphate transferase 3 [Euwallacea fornicatus]|uniref:GPI ethanolamine phosphate transferase 3 n=1 Tax=Euwallacea fornicatus TaxID=995702 RepID=UPI00338E145E
MKRKLKYFLTLLWFSYLIVTSILLFAKGFLLTRHVQYRNATCLYFDEETCYINNDQRSQISNCNAEALNPYENAHELCLKVPVRVVVLIVDALRYDFTVFDGKNKNPLSYENKIPVIKEILDKHPQSSKLYKFIADPPTTTMQRVKALTTGSLPTFIDAGSNFATSAIDEDNIIDQILMQNGKIVFMGDDTWTSLYPQRFIRNYPYPSFDVWDLDTVDNGVKSHLFSELIQKDWNLLIGHFLGVDHCGHRYGPNHPEMGRKLREINEVIRKVAETMDDNSLLFVIGDHGMTSTGDHGGESLDEISAAMFVYSKRHLLPIDHNRINVKQVDLVPTLSALLGIPTPFQNLGILIPSALPALETTPNSWRLPLFWLWSNVRQIITYIKAYSQTSKIFDEVYLELYYEEYEKLFEELKSINSDSQFELFYKKCEEFLIKVRTLCEEVWIQFDAFSISNGLTFLFLTVFFMFIISDGIPFRQLPLAIEGSFVVVCVIGLCFSAVAIAVLDFTDFVNNFLYNSIFITNILSHLMFLLPIFQNWDVISLNWYSRNKAHGIISLICRFVLIFNISIVFSNSFINEEASVLLFLLVSLIILTLLELFSFGRMLETGAAIRKVDHVSVLTLIKLLIAAAVVLVLLRSSMYFWRCRVEQEWCFKSSHYISNNLKSQASKFQWGLSVISLSSLTILIKMWLRKCGNLNGFSVTEICTKLLPSVLLVFIAGFWVLQRLSGNTKSISRTGNYLALSVYILSINALVLVLTQPICVSVILRNGERISPTSEHKIWNIFKALRNNLKNPNSGDQGGSPIVCGLGTAYSAVYVILGTYMLLLIALVLGDLFSFAMVVKMAVGIFFLWSTSILRIKMASSIDDLLNVPTIAVLGWILLPQYFFYATGHQPAFSNIAWESAFVGTSGLFTNNYILGTLVILNTFGTYIFSGLLLPLLIIAPFTILVTMPSVCGKQKGFYAIAQKGELLIFERDRMATSALFVVSCKYIAGHTVKVFASMLAATIHCRHLMVWNVFAPKFIFEALGLFSTIGSVLLGYLVFLRINSQLERLLQRLNKIY